jgi:hypothetical protein
MSRLPVLLCMLVLITGCAHQSYPELPADVAAQTTQNNLSAAVQPTAQVIDQSATALAAETAVVADLEDANGPVSQVVSPPPPDPDSLPLAQSRELKIKLGDRRFEYYEDGAMVWSGKVSAGRPEKRTPSGQFRVTAKDVNKRSGSYTNYFNWPTPMPYALQFNGPYWIHEGYVPDENASAGCVRLRHDDAKFVYARMRVGDPVSVVQ